MEEAPYGGAGEVIAHDLNPGETPVGVGTVVKPNHSGRLRVTTLVAACRLLPHGMRRCDPPEERGTRELNFVLKPWASLATAKYDYASFGPKDNELTGDHENAKVVGLDLKGAAAPATSFEGTGYVFENGHATRPATRQIGLNQSFFIYADDIFQPSLYGVLDLVRYGVDRPSGLTWPHVIGHRNGRTFWYSARLPSIVRDRVSVACVEIPAFVQPKGPGTSPPSKDFPVVAVKDSYYRLPFPKGVGPGTGAMNIDDPTPTGRHGDGQPYGFDFDAPLGTPVLAARGGVVVQQEDDDPYNAADRPAGWSKIGNYIWIRHEDGSYAVYFHNKVNTSEVANGQVVRRGERIAETGNTGQSSEPHVHFETFHLVNGKSVTDVRARIEAVYGANKEWRSPCYLPRSGGAFFSTNGLPTGD